LSTLKPLVAATKKANNTPLNGGASKVAKKIPPSQKAKLLAAQKAAEKAALSAAAEGDKARKGGLVADALQMEEYKIKATVAWLADGGKKVGLQFSKLPESQKRQIEVFLKGLCV